MSKKITIICSNYNSDIWIEEYLRYVNYQKNSEFDIIFIDACSTDNSLNKIKSFKFNPNIECKIIECKEKIGLYAAWNIGIKIAKTDYIMNFNTDDMLFDYALETYEKWIKQDTEADIIFGPFGLVKTRDMYNFVSYAKWPKYNHALLMYEYLCGPFPLIKKKVFEEIGYFDESYISAGDYEMVARMSKNGYNFRQIDQCIGCFYERSDSISNRDKQLLDDEIKRVKDRYK
jgi:GT2 family glycosyltransferase